MNSFQAIQAPRAEKWITDKVQFLRQKQIKIWMCAWMKILLRTYLLPLPLWNCASNLNNESFSSSSEVMVLSSSKNHLFQVLKAMLSSLLIYWKSGITKLRCKTWSSSLNQVKMFSCIWSCIWSSSLSIVVMEKGLEQTNGKKQNTHVTYPCSSGIFVGDNKAVSVF